MLAVIASFDDLQWMTCKQTSYAYSKEREKSRSDLRRVEGQGLGRREQKLTSSCSSYEIHQGRRFWLVNRNKVRVWKRRKERDPRNSPCACIEERRRRSAKETEIIESRSRFRNSPLPFFFVLLSLIKIDHHGITVSRVGL